MSDQTGFDSWVRGARAAAAALLLLLACGCTTLSAAAPDAEIAAADLSTRAVDLATAPVDSAGRAGRDWAALPAVVELDTGEDIYALGDIHADYERLVALLVKQQLLAAAPALPEAAQWAAGRAVLVVTGDVIDKWNQGRKALTLLQALRDSAAAAGGRVVVTLGNHEAEFLADPTASKVADFAMELKAAGIAAEDVAAGRHPLGVYLRGLPAAARVRDWFFCHAGYTAGRTLARLRADLQSGIDAQGFQTPALLDADSLLEARIDSPAWWERPGDPQGVLPQYAQALGVRHIVMGHQPGSYSFADGMTRSKGMMFQRFGILFLTDVGMSQGVKYSQGALLRIQTRGAQTTATALYADGTMALLWQG